MRNIVVERGGLHLKARYSKEDGSGMVKGDRPRSLSPMNKVGRAGLTSAQERAYLISIFMPEGIALMTVKNSLG